MQMPKQAVNPLERFEKPRSGLPLSIVGGLVFVLLFIGAVISVQSGDWIATIVVAAGLLMFCGYLLLSVSRERSRAGIADRRAIKWNAASPEIQRQNVNLEVRELVRQLDVGENQLTDLLSAYIVAEDLALRQIQQEEKLPLLRHVELSGITFDAILVEQELLTCIEVAFLVVPDVRQDKIESMLKKIAATKRNLAARKLRLKLRLMLLLVTQLSEAEEDHLRAMLVTDRFTNTPVDIDIRLLDFEVLQRTYLTDQ